MAYAKKDWETVRHEAIQQAKAQEEAAKEMEDEGHLEIAHHMREERDDWFRIAQLIARLALPPLKYGTPIQLRD